MHYALKALSVQVGIEVVGFHPFHLGACGNDRHHLPTTLACGVVGPVTGPQRRDPAERVLPMAGWALDGALERRHGQDRSLRWRTETHSENSARRITATLPARGCQRTWPSGPDHPWTDTPMHTYRYDAVNKAELASVFTT